MRFFWNLGPTRTEVRGEVEHLSVGFFQRIRDCVFAGLGQHLHRQYESGQDETDAIRHNQGPLPRQDAERQP